MQFSESTNNTGIVQQTRDLMRVDSTQWATSKIVNSCNNWLDFISGYAIMKDRRFQWDDTNHTKLPIGTINIVASQSDYSFLVDEQSNRILTLTRIDVLDSAGKWHQLISKDQSEIGMALDEFESTNGIPKYYDKIADNVVRLYPTPSANVTSGLKFYFQRTPSYFVGTDTTKEPGVPQILHRGFVIASAYDGALTLGLNNLQPLSVEIEKERQKVIDYFGLRNQDEIKRLRANVESTR